LSAGAAPPRAVAPDPANEVTLLDPEPRPSPAAPEGVPRASVVPPPPPAPPAPALPPPDITTSFSPRERVSPRETYFDDPPGLPSSTPRPSASNPVAISLGSTWARSKRAR